MSCGRPNNPSRRPDAPCNPSSPPGAPTIYHVRRTSSTAHLVGQTSPATYPFDQTSHTTSPVGRMSYNVLLAFDRPPDTFPRLLNLQNLQLATRRPAHSCASSNQPPDTSRRGSRISSPADHPLRASTLLEFVTGRGGAGFHSPGPALTTGRGGYFRGDPRPAPVRGESPLIPWTGPCFSPLVLRGTRLGNGRGRGQGQGTLEKPAPPRAVQ